MTGAEAARAQWDAIVIGAGLGGGIAARALAEAGQKVLILERGTQGQRTAQNGLDATGLPEARLVRGMWPEPLNVTLDGREHRFFAPLGAGVGGSSVFYAATLERPERHDLDDLPDRPHPTGGWPVSFDAMAPWFARAARLFRLYGTPDPLSDSDPLPLRTPPPFTPVETALNQALSDSGLHPYHAPTALDDLQHCRKCLGRKCPRACKMDGRSAGIEPALATGNAQLLTRALVTRLVPDGDRIAGVEASVGGEVLRFSARHVVLAGGALNSPRVLLASTSEAWPDGLANRSGLVGRNLMFHLNEMFALWPSRGHRSTETTKSIAFRDLYHDGSTRFGAIQSLGVRASYGEILHYLRLALKRSMFQQVPGLDQAARLPAALAAGLFGDAQIFVGLLEDLPYRENRVLFDPSSPDRLAVQYSFAPELLDRRRAFRRALRRATRGQRRLLIGFQPELNYGHPCGTLRFGADPATSVFDPDGRAHGIRNLWIADASALPTSMGVNPSLTIAALALRTAQALAKDTAS